MQIFKSIHFAKKSSMFDKKYALVYSRNDEAQTALHQMKFLEDLLESTKENNDDSGYRTT